MNLLSVLSSLLFLPMTIATIPGDCTAAGFTPYLPPNVTINVISSIQGPNGSFGDLSDKDFPAIDYNLPDLCAVSLNVTSNSTNFSFGLYLPATWNNRLIGTGNTGFGGGINWPFMGHLVHYGSVAFSIDTGHNSGPSDASWALAESPLLDLWGYEAMHESLLAAKTVVQNYYNDKLEHSYYMACSGGGRQGMKEMQLYPDDFQGYAIGAPPWELSHLHTWAAYVGTVNLPINTALHIEETLLSNLTTNVTDLCADNLSQPWLCNLDTSQLLCNETTGPTCLTPSQLSTFTKIFSPWTNSTDFLFPSVFYGSDISGLAAGSSTTGQPSSFGTQYIDNFLYNTTTWDYTTLNATLVANADSLDAGSSNADSFDLSAFAATGGKALFYHGLADPLIPAGNTIYYYEHLLNISTTLTTPLNVSSFLKLYLIPSMHHCSGSTGGAPYFIAGGGQKLYDSDYTYSVPGFEDPDHDIVLQLMAWVETGREPNRLIASQFQNHSAVSGVERQKPLCPYPQTAVFAGYGNETADSGLVGHDNADNWHCVQGTPVGYPEMKIWGKGEVMPTPAQVVPVRTKSSGASTFDLEGVWKWLMIGLLALIG